MLAYEHQLSIQMKAALYQWLKKIQGSVDSAACLLCGCEVLGDLCAACQSDLPRLTIACPRCALPLPADLSEGGEHGECGHCISEPPPQLRTLAPYRYDEPIKHLLHALKFHHKLYLARVLGSLLADVLAEDCARANFRPDVIIPIPLHPQRLRERGYNQALELARPIAARLKVPLDFSSCVRTRATPAQTDLPASQRLKNINGAFALRRPLRATRVAIVDDVMTTGATVGEFAALLLDHGVKEVQVWVVARALLKP